MNNNITIHEVRERLVNLALSKFFMSDRYDPFKSIEFDNIINGKETNSTAYKMAYALSLTGISKDISIVFDNIYEKFKSHKIQNMLYSIDEFFINLENESIMVGLEWHGLSKIAPNYNFNYKNNLAMVFNGNQHEIRFKVCMMDMDLQPFMGDINPRTPGRDISEPIPEWFIEAQKKRTN